MELLFIPDLNASSFVDSLMFNRVLYYIPLLADHYKNWNPHHKSVKMFPLALGDKNRIIPCLFGRVPSWNYAWFDWQEDVVFAESTFFRSFSVFRNF